MIVILEILGAIVVGWLLLGIATVGLFHGAKWLYLRRVGS